MKIKFWSLLLAPLIASILFGLLVHLGLSQPAAIVTSITMLTVTWWVTSALPIPVTSLLPFILFPTFGIFDHSKVASFIGSD
ncbi:MAG: SLC13/DASS family transporter, partial [Parashewanella sp.]